MTGTFGSNPAIHVLFTSPSLDFTPVRISDEKYEHVCVIKVMVINNEKIFN
jgi:hypothetical protein